VTASGLTTFAGAVGNLPGMALLSLTTDGGGTTAINGESVTTSDFQEYDDAVTLGGTVSPKVLTSNNGGDITFASTLNGPRGLTVDTAGTITFGGAVGETTTGTALANLTTLGGGTTAINGTSVTTTGIQHYEEDVTLG